MSFLRESAFEIYNMICNIEEQIANGEMIPEVLDMSLMQDVKAKCTEIITNGEVKNELGK